MTDRLFEESNEERIARLRWRFETDVERAESAHKKAIETVAAKAEAVDAAKQALEDFDLALPDTQAGRDVLTLLRRGDLGQCSFAAVLEREDWDYDSHLRAPVRTVLAAELLEVSVVPLPAFANTTARAEA